MSTPPDQYARSLVQPFRWWMLLGCCIIALCLIPDTCCAPAHADERNQGRFIVGFADGSDWRARRITAWLPDKPSFKLDDREMLTGSRVLRSVRDTRAAYDKPTAAWVETRTGDRIPGSVIEYHAGSDPEYPVLPPHFIVRSTTSPGPPQQHSEALVRVIAASVRRIVWQRPHRPSQPGTVVCKDGRTLSFRALRWGTVDVTLLLDDGRRKVNFDEMAELHQRDASPWPFFFDELALLAPNGKAPLVQVETADGLVATTCWKRQRIVLPQDRRKADRWMHGLQPAWSLDMLWLPGDNIRLRRFFSAAEIALSRVRPAHVVQQSAFAQAGRPWQRDRNVDGGPLSAGHGEFGWGFGVHVRNELHFDLPTAVHSFSSHFGIDRSAREGGCVRARIRLVNGSSRTLFESPVLVGSHQTVATGLCRWPALPARRTLILEVDDAHENRPRGADPFDVRDSADWLGPVLHLDRALLTKITADRAAHHVFAWDGWQQVEDPMTGLDFGSVWDEFSEVQSAFRTGIAVSGRSHLRLQQRRLLRKGSRFLVVLASTPRRADPPVRIEVLADGKRLIRFEAPILDRRHSRLVPQVISLSALGDRVGHTVEFEIRQSPGPLDAPVQWHRIHFTDDEPAADSKPNRAE